MEYYLTKAEKNQLGLKSYYEKLILKTIRVKKNQ